MNVMSTKKVAPRRLKDIKVNGFGTSPQPAALVLINVQCTRDKALAPRLSTASILGYPVRIVGWQVVLWGEQTYMKRGEQIQLMTQGVVQEWSDSSLLPLQKKRPAVPARVRHRNLGFALIVVAARVIFEFR